MLSFFQKIIISGYKEGDINFQPTYKYDPGTHNWDSSEKEPCPLPNLAPK